LRKYGGEITKIVPRVLKSGKIPGYISNPDDELAFLEASRSFLAAEFGCDLEIVKADASQEQKAGQAVPGKPAILVE